MYGFIYRMRRKLNFLQLRKNTKHGKMIPYIVDQVLLGWHKVVILNSAIFAHIRGAHPVISVFTGIWPSTTSKSELWRLSRLKPMTSSMPIHYSFIHAIILQCSECVLGINSVYTVLYSQTSVKKYDMFKYVHRSISSSLCPCESTWSSSTVQWTGGQKKIRWWMNHPFNEWATAKSTQKWLAEVIWQNSLYALSTACITLNSMYSIWLVSINDTPKGTKIASNQSDLWAKGPLSPGDPYIRGYYKRSCIWKNHEHYWLLHFSRNPRKNHINSSSRPNKGMTHTWKWDKGV